MDPTPLPPLSTATVATATTIPLTYPDSLDSPRDGAVDDDPLPPKLRLMCSFGGHIIPRPHDKSLCYVGGETRIVVVDRHSSLADLSARLSLALLHGRPFALKYQLPTEDLDSLISVTNDEDLLNMIDEYDRAASPSALRPSRLRLFLFFTKSETATSRGTLLDDSNSETWFVDALNNAGILPRGLSDSSTGMDCLVNPNHDPPSDLEAQIEDHNTNTNTNTNDNSKQVKAVQDVQFAMPDSPVVENSSSYGSSSSSPSMSNLPPIRARVDQGSVGIDDQLAQISIAASHLYRHDDGYGAFSAPPPPFPSGIMAGTALNVAASTSMANQAGGCGENMSSRAASDDERSDQEAPPTAFRKPPLPMLQPVQVQPLQHKASAANNLPSPDSVASDNSIASASSLSRSMHHEDQSHVGLKEQRSGPFSPTPRTDPADPTPQAPVPQAADPSYALTPPSDHLPPLPPQPSPQTQQQQFVHMSTHYIPQPAQSQSPVLVSSYYPVYQMQSQQQQQQLHHPVYMMPDGSVVGQARPLPTSSPASAQPAGGYKDLTVPIYHAAKTPGQVTPEMASSMYNSYMASHQPLIQVPAGPYQQQHSGMMAQINQQPQPAGGATNYVAFDCSYSAHDLASYSQHQASVLPSQYQNLVNAGTVADAPKQPSSENA